MLVTPGFVLRASSINLEFIDTLPPVDDGEFKCTLALDEVVDPMNLGALLRSAHFLGCDKVVVCTKNSSPLSPTLVRPSFLPMLYINFLLLEKIGIDEFASNNTSYNVTKRSTIPSHPSEIILNHVEWSKYSFKYMHFSSN